MASAAKCRDPVSTKVLRKRAKRARREFDARFGALSKGKTVRRPPIKKLSFNGGVSEDREEWMEEVRRHCERCYDEKDEPTQVQEKRIQEQEKRKKSPGGVDRRRGGGHGGQGTKGGKVMKNKANGLEECLVSEKYKNL